MGKILGERHVGWILNPFTPSLHHPHLCIFPATPSSPISSLKFLLHHKHILLKDRSKWIVVIEFISDTHPLFPPDGNLVERGLETGRKPEGGAAVIIYILQLQEITHKIRHDLEEQSRERHSNVRATGESKRPSFQ